MNNLKTNFLLLLLCGVLCSAHLSAQSVKGAAELSLNGNWEMGLARNYTSTVIVPGIASDPTKMSDGPLWYKRTLKLPDGNWKSATLELKGARFQPQVYINGEFVAKQEGGMAPVFMLLKSESIKPGNTVTIEIALASLKNVPQSDASYIAQADHWRSNISSCLWDDVVLHLHGEASISRIIPFVDDKNQVVHVNYELNSALNFKGSAILQVLDQKGRILLSKTQSASGSKNTISFAIGGKLKRWSTDNPNLYKLNLQVSDHTGLLSDQSAIAFALKKFEVVNKQFYLNNNHLVARGPTVVWHRWMRTKEGRELGYDTAWFNKNIVQRTKQLGGNYLRFHLGLPPERFLDLCDRYGLIVQYEWSFFHGMPASEESLLVQYKSWLDLAMRHPSVSLIHPYNETGGDQLKTVWSALDKLLPDYPQLVLEDRDVMHIHKYWWSLFENVGLFYDNADVFPKAVLSDEFGGNYLDEQGNMGAYTTVKETYLRFLGRQHTTTQRLAFHAMTNAKIAEYWRRIGAAGYAPFTALASYEDGNTWFMGPLKEGNPKPVWEALTASFSPQSVSIELWDRDFEPGQILKVPVYVFNDVDIGANLSVRLRVENKAGKVFYTRSFTSSVSAFGRKIQPVSVTMPLKTGDYVIKAELLNKPVSVKHRVISEWGFRVFKASVPENVKNLKIAVFTNETELRKLLSRKQLQVVDQSDASADLIVTGLNTWKLLAKSDAATSALLQSAISSGKSIVMLDVGNRPLGQGYPEKAGDFGPLQSVVRVSNPKISTYNLFGGVSLKFTETAEPESHLHPDKLNHALWNNLPDEYTWLWNGLRGGLIVPAEDMEFLGLSSKAFIAQWKSRGANEDKIIKSPYFAYELQGFYEFSDLPNDRDAQKKLKDKVNFLVQDAPALAISINPNTPVAITDLAKGYRDSEKGMAENLVPLANSGKNLTQTPVALVDFGSGKGKLLVSQLLTSGRLANGFGEPGLYGIRYDEVAVQYVLNMISLSVKE